MAEVPVTQGQFDLWKADLGPGGYQSWYNHNAGHLELYFNHRHTFLDPDRISKTVLHPVEMVDMREALAFIEWLEQQEVVREQLQLLVDKLAPMSKIGIRISLPSEALWEYACRAGTETDYWSGDGEAALVEVGWYGRSSASISTHRVGAKPANPWSLFDMHGNVLEWCTDRFDGVSYSRKAPFGFSGVPLLNWRELHMSISHVARGGSWTDTPRGCRSAYRFGAVVSTRRSILGFRLCLLPFKGPYPSRSLQ